jgi:DNA-binding MarR family transcriptional regulator/GNAT superfamily N-acetyltransferase
MERTMIDQVRRFNRAVTQRAGALDDAFLARGRPLGQARVLWEIGPDGRDVRDLRARLDLDSGYLSRLLRALERDGLVTVEANEADGRIRTARLTVAGEAERAELDRLSDASAASLLQPLSGAQRARLVAAMAEVERLLLASSVRIAVTDPHDPQARACLRGYAAELAGRFPGGFDPARSNPATDDDLTPPSGLLLIATWQGEPAGCGAVKFHPGAPAEIKRMWVAPAARGLGLGRQLLEQLETHATAHGARVARLETNQALAEAISLYRSAGYREVAPFNDEPYAHHWFEKILVGDQLTGASAATPARPAKDQPDGPGSKRAR